MQPGWSDKWNWIFTYKGRLDMWMWVLHRVTGLGLLVFLLLHIINIAYIGWGEEVFNEHLVLYTHPLFRLGEIALFAALLYHALNGLRIIAIDFWPASTRFRKEMALGVGIVFAVLFILVAIKMLSDMLA